MAAILQKAWAGYTYLFVDLADQRLISWPFISKPYQGITLLVVYLMFVLKWGPKWMENRKPYNLNKVLIVYNSLQIFLCAYIFQRGIYKGWGWTYKWVCEPVDYSDAPLGITAAKLTYLYFLTKLLDLFDTVFFVLRKKYNQVSFLHLYHHTGMVVLVWGTVTYFPGGHCTFLGIINCAVHVVMYTYYLLTVVAPEKMKNVVWFKKLITQLQILQFFCGFVHTSTLLMAHECEYPRWVCSILIPQNFFILALFTDFYIKTYMKKPKLQAKEDGNETLPNGHHNIVKNGVNKHSINNNIAKNGIINNGVTKTKIQDTSCVINNRSNDKCSKYD